MGPAPATGRLASRGLGVPRAAIWLAVALATTYALFIGGGAAGVQVPSLGLLSLAISSVAFAAWGVAAMRNRAWRPRSALMPALLAGVAALAISTALSRSPRISAEYLAFGVLLAGLYLLFVRMLAVPWLRSRLLALISLAGPAVAILYVGAVLLDWSRFWGLAGQITFPLLRPDNESLIFTNPSGIAARVVLFSAISIGWAGMLRERAKYVRLAVLPVCFVALILTGTRAAWLSAAAGLAVAFAASIGWRGFGDLRSRVHPGAFALGRRPTVLFVAIVTPLALLLLAPGLMDRVTQGADPARATLAQIAIRMFTSSPIVGVGPGMWAALRLPYTSNSELDFYAAHAHNAQLQAAAEMGTVGIVAGIVIAIATLRLIRSGLRDADPDRRRWALVALGASVYFVLHESFDFFESRPGIIIAFCVPLAVLDATGAVPPVGAQSGRAPRRIALGVGAMALAVAIGFSVWTELPADLDHSAVVLANSGHWQEAQPLAQAAADDDREMPIYHVTAGVADAHVGNDELAAIELQRAAEETDLPEAWLGLAEVQAEMGLRNDASVSLQRALRLGVQRGAIAVAATDLAIRLDQQALAVSAATASFKLLPSVASDGWWHANAARESVYAQAIASAIATSTPDVAWEIALMSGALADARSLVRNLPPDQAREAADVIAGWDGDLNAFARVTAACKEHPLDGPLRWCSRISAKLGFASDAQRYLAWGAILGISEQRLREIRIVTGPAMPSTAGNPADSFGIAFRRWSLWDPIVPGLPHLILQ
jgi:O-antigen ligase